jgi:hypothetical protein
MLGSVAMTGDTVDCFNCGRSNPSWAQVCRSCGVPMRPGGAGAAPPAGPIPTDRDSLVSIAAALGTMVLAIVLGFLLSGMLPEAAAVIETPTPEPTATVVPSASTLPSATPETTPKPKPLPGHVSFGFGLDQTTNEIRDVSGRFSRGQQFCHSVTLKAGRFQVGNLQEEILKVADDGSLTVVQRRQDGKLPIDPKAQTVGFCAPADALVDGAAGTQGWGTGRFVLRDYRVRGNGPELLAQGRFTLTE